MKGDTDKLRKLYRTGEGTSAATEVHMVFLSLDQRRAAGDICALLRILMHPDRCLRERTSG